MALAPGVSHLNRHYSNYRKRAKQRGIDWNLDINEFWHIVKLNCRYCGTKPSIMKCWHHVRAVIPMNGVDRVDNTQGYHKMNCVPCCTKCNYLKGSSNVEEFLDHIVVVYEHMTTSGQGA